MNSSDPRPSQGEDEKTSGNDADLVVEKDEASESESRRMWRQAGQFGFIGIEFGVATAIGFFVGEWLDGKLDTKPWLSLIFALLGIAAASRDLYSMVKRAQREDRS